MILFFAWLAWIWIAITGFGDIFRRHDIGGWTQGPLDRVHHPVPFLGVFVYLIAQHDGLHERSMKQSKDQQAAFDDYVPREAGGSAPEIAKAKDLLDSGAITREDFDGIKAKALSS